MYCLLCLNPLSRLVSAGCGSVSCLAIVMSLWFSVTVTTRTSLSTLSLAVFAKMMFLCTLLSVTLFPSFGGLLLGTLSSLLCHKWSVCHFYSIWRARQQTKKKNHKHTNADTTTKRQRRTVCLCSLVLASSCLPANESVLLFTVVKDLRVLKSLSWLQ